MARYQWRAVLQGIRQGAAPDRMKNAASAKMRAAACPMNTGTEGWALAQQPVMVRWPWLMTMPCRVGSSPVQQARRAAGDAFIGASGQGMPRSAVSGVRRIPVRRELPPISWAPPRMRMFILQPLCCQC